MKRKVFFLFLISSSLGVVSHLEGLTPNQSIIISIFSVSILGTLFFWEFRLPFVFIGSGLLLLIHAVDLENFIRFASLDVILFLIGMMIILGMMKEEGFFLWFVTVILRIKNLDGRKMFILIMIISALLSAVMDEVTSIIIMLSVIFEICGFLEISPVPMFLSSVLATNIGSASTVLGNPIGILIAARSKLSFVDFILHALPISALVLAVIIPILLFWYREYVKELSLKLKDYAENKFFTPYLYTFRPQNKNKYADLWYYYTIDCPT